jgi:23S rRNA (guanosine2251-2'-O)-methyltransferase
VAETIYGRNPVLEALRAGQLVKKLLLAEGVRPRGTLAEIVALAEAKEVPLQWVERRELDKVHPHHQGVVAQVGEYRYAAVEDIMALARERREKPLLLILDCLQDVHNFGSLLRTAEAVGAHGVIIPQRRAVRVTAAVRKASAGAVEHLLVTRVPNLARTLEELKGEGLWIIGLDMAGLQAYDEVDLDISLALVVGSEGKGLRRLVQERCDLLIRLPMRGQVSSLNAAVAGSIVLYEAWRQRARRGSRSI